MLVGDSDTRVHGKAQDPGFKGLQRRDTPKAVLVLIPE